MVTQHKHRVGQKMHLESDLSSPSLSACFDLPGCHLQAHCSEVYIMQGLLLKQTQQQ